MFYRSLPPMSNGNSHEAKVARLIGDRDRVDRNVLAHCRSACAGGSVCARHIEAPRPQNIPTSASALAVPPGLLKGARAVQSETARNAAVSYSEYGCRLLARADANWERPWANT